MADNILNLMIIQHGILESLFSVFHIELQKGETEKAKNSLSEFSTELKRHFFIEEDKIITIIDQIKKEHSIMIEDLEKMSQNVSGLKSENIEPFIKLLKSHRDIEEKSLYPKLDANLSDAQKNQIIKKANEVK